METAILISVATSGRVANMGGHVIARVTGTTGSGTAAGDGTAAIDVSSLALVQGDFIVLGINHGSATTDKDMSGSGNNSGAGTEVADLYANSTNDTNLWVGLFKQGATPDTTLTISGMAASGGYAYALSVWRGVDQSTPQDVAAVTATGATSDLADPPAITPVTAGARIVAVYAASQGTATAWTAPTDVNDFAQVGLNKSRAGMGNIQWTGGAFDPAAVGEGNASASNSWAAVSMALRPA